MPKPLFSKLVATYATGFFCLLLGSIFAYSTQDWLFFFMSLILFTCCMGKGFLLQRVIRNRRYYIVTGICQQVSHVMFQRISKVTLLLEDMSIEVYHLDKSIPLHPGHRYQLYFKKPSGMSASPKDAFQRNPYARYTQEFLGYEELPRITKQESLP
ncbi:MAG: hypothetical protein PHN80_13465 [Hespellia sp.]|nr:hypothetical protein [Hespellia sp.]